MGYCAQNRKRLINLFYALHVSDFYIVAVTFALRPGNTVNYSKQLLWSCTSFISVYVYFAFLNLESYHVNSLYFYCFYFVHDEP